MAKVNHGFRRETGVPYPMTAAEFRNVEGLFQTGRGTYLLDDFQTAAHTDDFGVLADRFDTEEGGFQVIHLPKHETQVRIGLGRFLCYTVQSHSMHLSRPVRIVAGVAKFDLSDEVVRAMGAKHCYSRRVRTATCEGFKHAQQHLAQGEFVPSRLIEVTDNSAHHRSSIRIVYCKYYRSNNFLKCGILLRDCPDSPGIVVSFAQFLSRNAPTYCTPLSTRTTRLVNS